MKNNAACVLPRDLVGRTRIAHCLTLPRDLVERIGDTNMYLLHNVRTLLAMYVTASAPSVEVTHEYQQSARPGHDSLQPRLPAEQTRDLVVGASTQPQRRLYA